MSDLNTPEPAPIHNNKPATWELVIADMRERDVSGRAKYGTPLQPFNGRNNLTDLYQELLDAVVYTRNEIEERAAVSPAPACRCAELAAALDRNDVPLIVKIHNKIVNEPLLAEIQRLRGVIDKARHDVLFLPNNPARLADEISEIEKELQAALSQEVQG